MDAKKIVADRIKKLEERIASFRERLDAIHADMVKMPRTDLVGKYADCASSLCSMEQELVTLRALQSHVA